VGAFYTIGQTSDAVFVAGQVGADTPGGPTSFWVQAYDAGSGALLWDDRSHPGTTAAAMDLAVGKLRVFVAGYSQSAGNADWVIRTYDNRIDAFLTAP
jgi:hypothetical protein